jgi:hypothetical protein
MITRNKIEKKEKTSKKPSLAFMYDLTSLQLRDTQINIEVKMNNVSFTSEHISFYFVKEECVESDECGEDKCKEKENTTLKKTLTIGENTKAYFYNLEKKPDTKCLIIKIVNDLVGNVTIINNQEYNFPNIKGGKFNETITISPTNEPIYLLILEENYAIHVEIIYDKDENIEKEIEAIKYGYFNLENIKDLDNIPIGTKFYPTEWKFKHTVLGKSYCYFSNFTDGGCPGIEIPKLSKNITIKYSKKEYFDSDSKPIFNTTTNIFSNLYPINRFSLNEQGRASPFYIEITTNINETKFYYMHSKEVQNPEEKFYGEYKEIKEFKIKQREVEVEKDGPKRNVSRFYYQIDNKNNDTDIYISFLTKTTGLNYLRVRMVNYDASDVPIIQPNTSSTIKVNKNKTTLLLFNVTSIIESSIYYRMIYNISDFDLISNLNIFIYTSDQKADDFVEFSDNIQPSAKFTCDFSFTFDNGTTICYSSYKQSSFPTRMFYIIPESNSTTDKQIEFYATDIKEYATFSSAFIPKQNTSAPLNKINYLESQLKTYNIPNTYYVQIVLPSEFMVIHFYHKYKDTKYKSCGPYKSKEKDNNRTTTFYFGPINRTEEQTDVEFLLDVLTTNITEDTKFVFYIIDNDESPNDVKPFDPFNPNPSPGDDKGGDKGNTGEGSPSNKLPWIILFSILGVVIVAGIVLFFCFRETLSNCFPCLKQIDSSTINDIGEITEKNTP